MLNLMTPNTSGIDVAKPIVLSPEPTNFNRWNWAFIEPFFETYSFLFKSESHLISPYFYKTYNTQKRTKQEHY